MNDDDERRDTDDAPSQRLPDEPTESTADEPASVDSENATEQLGDLHTDPPADDLSSDEQTTAYDLGDTTQHSVEPGYAEPEYTDQPAATPPPHVSGWRGAVARNPVRVVLSAIIIGAVVAAVVAVAAGLFDDSGSVGQSDIGESERIEDNAFAKSVPGDCLDWPPGNPGQPAKVDCAQKHRFEVAGALDTSVFPGAEFGEDGPWPGDARFATIRDEQCPVIVNEYMAGRLDPHGKFSVGMMYPSQYEWERGARALRCGLQQSGPDGQPMQYSGRVADQDQSLVWPEGTCIGIDRATRKPTGYPVNCAEPHAFQTTGIVDLSVRFGDRLSGKPWPNIRTQNDYLANICPVQAERFVGGKAKFEATTLNVNSSVIQEASWLAGSRKVVCFLALPDKRGGFATLVGDAKGGGELLLINGKRPVAPPQAPPGRALPTPVPLPPGVQPNPQEVPAPAG
ncbi:septum formation family protein [Gordonia sp. ABSL49_1]|uniref:septum formation family protein n=1 Tax=Gordonia sp. ABSL49_1 TaxID=2920941 RepID=UPI001F0CFEAF|nr:septum formation family protein [Gordonia sp. ABSL49_1]MCH5642860.1 septum formation family protein [Gordonia sp. ABSL49_1]